MSEKSIVASTRSRSRMRNIGTLTPTVNSSDVTPRGSSTSSVRAWMTHARDVWAASRVAVDDQGGDASAAQLGGQGKADRSGADDENFGLAVHGWVSHMGSFMPTRRAACDRVTGRPQDLVASRVADAVPEPAE